MRRCVGLAGIILVAAAPLLWMWSAGWARAQDVLLVVFEDIGRGFALGIPQGWETIPVPGGAVAFYGPPPAEMGFRPRCHVLTDTVPGDVDLATFAAASELLLRGTLDDYAMVRQRSQTIGGVPAVVRHYTWKSEENVKLYSVQAQMVRGRFSYTIRCTTVNDRAALNGQLLLFERVIASFSIRR